jgi:endonuclease YncB( thermonuclease family)
MKGKYGRYVADIWVKGSDGEFINVNDTLVEAGHAEYVQY